MFTLSFNQFILFTKKLVLIQFFFISLIIFILLAILKNLISNFIEFILLVIFIFNEFTFFATLFAISKKQIL